MKIVDEQYERIVTERELEVPTNWAMFKSEGNGRITGYARTALRKAEKANGDLAKVEKAVLDFYLSWLRLGRDPQGRFGEALDTAVRECVRWFGQNLLRAGLGFDRFEASDQEEAIYEKAMIKDAERGR